MSVPSTERWLPIPGFPGYEISDAGRVMSYKRRTPRLLAPARDTEGYLHLTLRRDGRTLTRRVHVLVAESFHGPRPEGCLVRHLDGDQENNQARNLQWGLPVENAADMRRHGTNYWTNKTHCPFGHPYSPENTAVYGSARHCRACKNASSRARRIARALAAANAPDSKVG